MLIENSQRIEVDVEPAIHDSQHLEVLIYSYKMHDAQEVVVAVLPAIHDSQRILATVRNQAYQAAAEERLIAPDADITFE